MLMNESFMSSTDFRVLCAVQGTGGVSDAAGVRRHLHTPSYSPLAASIPAALGMLEKNGYLERRGEFWFLTPAGRERLKLPRIKPKPRKPKRGVFPQPKESVS
jgi:hypothetical protein